MVKKEIKVDKVNNKVAKNDVVDNEQNTAPNQKRVQLTPDLANNLFNVEKRRYESINTELTKIQKYLLDTDKTLFAVNELTKSTDDAIFVNLGSGVYVNAKIENKQKAKFMVGTDVFLEKSFDEILITLKERRQKLAKDLENLQKLMTQSQNNLNQLYGYLTQVNSKAKPTQ